jgi:glutaredoxin-related protein
MAIAIIRVLRRNAFQLIFLTHTRETTMSYLEVLQDQELQAEFKEFVESDTHDEVQDGTHLILNSEIFIDTAEFSNEEALVYRIEHYALETNINDIRYFTVQQDAVDHTLMKTVYLAEKSHLIDYLAEQLKSSY